MTLSALPSLTPPDGSASRPADPPLPATRPGARRRAGVTAVELCGATRTYGSTVALDGVDLAIRAGETVALLGPNGAGKSTAIGLTLGLLAPTAGAVEVLGQSPADAVRSGRIGAMLQESGLPAFARVGELVELVRALHPRPMPFDDVVRRAGLGDLVERRAEGLSGGEQQRVRFAMAIAGDPDLLFLDEPTVAMDVETRRAFWADMQAFAAEGRTILFATHYLEEADQVADRIVVLDHGRVVADGTSTSIKATTHLRRVRFRTADADRAVLAGLPGVRSVEIGGDDRVLLETADSDATLRALLAADPTAHDVEVGGPDLESAFLALTGADR